MTAAVFPFPARSEASPLHAALEASLTVDDATVEDLRAKARRFYARAGREPDRRIRAAFVTMANDLVDRSNEKERAP